MEQMNFSEAPKIAAPNEAHLACVLLLDTSGSMSDCIDNLNEAINKFKNEVCMDELSKKRVDVAIVTFDDNAHVVQPFTPISMMEPVKLTTGGCTSMGAAINMAIDMVKDRNKFYNRMGTECFKPWIFMITDGLPTDDISLARDRIKEEELKGTHGKLKFFAVGVDRYDKDTLFSLTPRVIELRTANFTNIFNWLSQSMVTISVSKPSAEAALDPLPPDARKADPDRDVSDW